MAEGFAQLAISAFKDKFLDKRLVRAMFATFFKAPKLLIPSPLSAAKALLASYEP